MIALALGTMNNAKIFHLAVFQFLKSGLLCLCSCTYPCNAESRLVPPLAVIGSNQCSAAYLHPGFQNPKWCVALALAQDDIMHVITQRNIITYLRKGSLSVPSHLLTLY